MKAVGTTHRKPSRCSRHAPRPLFESLESRLLLTTYYVDINATLPGNHNGLSWNGAFTSLQSVLPLATTGDTVLVADGTYKPTSTTDRTARFALRGGATFLGGYAGYGAPNPSARDTTLYPTILSGEIGSAGTTADNSYHVLLLGSGTGIVDGFTISGGNANGTANHYDLGGAIGMPEQDMLWMLNIVSFQISNCIFRDNFAITGGAVGNSQSCTFTNCLFINNSATSGGALGGGSGRFINCTFFDNSAVNGGAISVYNSSPFFLNGRFVGNSATAGGVVYVQPSTGNITPTFTNCDLVANSSGIGTGGVLYNNATSSTPAFSNCIAWDNGGTPFVRSNGNLFVAQITCCDIQGGSLIGSGNINADPQFVRTPTSTDLGDMHLLSTSPCIDVGNVSATGLTGTATLTDFDGQPRFTDIPSVHGAFNFLGQQSIDIGIYEARPVYLVYKNSGFAITDSAAIATDKRPMFPGQTASFDNYSSYDRGINGIIVDVEGLHTGIVAGDLTLAVGNDKSNWSAAPLPLSLTAVAGDTTNTWTRVTITWADHAIQDQWVQVTLKAGAHSGLASDLLFYFGSAPGESGNSAADAKVNATDQLAARSAATAGAAINNAFDYNRDGVVDSADEAIAAQGYTWFENELHLFTAATGATTISGSLIAVPETLGGAAQLGPAVPTGIVLTGVKPTDYRDWAVHSSKPLAGSLVKIAGIRQAPRMRVK